MVLQPTEGESHHVHHVKPYTSGEAEIKREETEVLFLPRGLGTATQSSNQSWFKNKSILTENVTLQGQECKGASPSDNIIHSHVCTRESEMGSPTSCIEDCRKKDVVSSN